MRKKRPFRLASDICLMIVLNICVSVPSLAAETVHTYKNLIRFDAVVELNASRGRTHIELFARYWVSPDSYRMVVVWAEPHAGHFNFPLYPPTLTIASDPNHFVVGHQFQHMYDSTFAKPFGHRGPFRHQFNTYHLSDIRFAEQESLGMYVCNDDLGLGGGDWDNREEFIDLPGKTASFEHRGIAMQAKVRVTDDRLSKLSLFDDESLLLESIEYGYRDGTGANSLRKQEVILPERPMTVGFARKGPTITVDGEGRRYSEFTTIHHAGGRRCTVEYTSVKIGGQDVPVPACIVVRSGDGTRVLRSARLYNYISCEMTPDQIETDATRFSAFDPHDIACRELLLRYWMKPPRDVSPADANSLQDLCTHFRDMPVADATVGEQLKQVNLLMQLDWMQEDMAKLETDFRKYLSLLSTNGLDRMILFGGQNVIEITIRWAQFRAAERLLPLWLDAALLRNDPNAILDFASANLATSRFWTTAKLMEKTMSKPTLSVEQRFLAQAYHAITLSGISRMASDPDHMVRRELDIAQVRWSLIGSDEGRLLAQARTSLDAARRAYASVTEPSQECRTLRKELDTIGRSVLGNGRSENEDSDPQGNGQIR